MKKVLSILFIAGMFTFYACGPNAEEKAKAEKEAQDSINAATAAAQNAATVVAADSSKMTTDTTAKK